MNVKTYRAKSMQEALQMVRRELGPDAAVLHSREVRAGLLSWLGGGRQIELVASNSVEVPSRLTASDRATDVARTGARTRRPKSPAASSKSLASAEQIPAADETNFRTKFRADLKGQIDQLSSLVEELCHRDQRHGTGELSQTLFQLFADLIDAEFAEDLARELVERVRVAAAPHEINDRAVLQARLLRIIENEITVQGPIQLVAGERRLVALVGPTGVGKTTTIAKLAANMRIREHKRVGLITVDTYRIAAVEQLRTYADIMDLPMEVVATPRELRDALAKLSDMDLILMDTAGRSPRDEVQIQELKSMLTEARPDEVHLVLSSVASVAQLKQAAERFAPVGTTHLLLTKLDEAAGLGNLLPLLRGCELPLSYLTDGQNVPDDIEAAERRKLARQMLNCTLERPVGNRH